MHRNHGPICVEQNVGCAAAKSKWLINLIDYVLFAQQQAAKCPCAHTGHTGHIVESVSMSMPATRKLQDGSYDLKSPPAAQVS